LFGSAARGSLRAECGVDLAILAADQDLAMRDELALQAEFHSEIVGRVARDLDDASGGFWGDS
jgi:predicted nucleotidyltransferase